jgi:hypothetical protein
MCDQFFTAILSTLIAWDFICNELAATFAYMSYIRHHGMHTLWLEPVREASQVFEYLTTDLKNFMDSTGKGPKSEMMPPNQIKVAPPPLQYNGPQRSGQPQNFATCRSCHFEMML